MSRTLNKLINMKRLLYILTAGSLFFSACKKDFLDRYPLDAISDEKLVRSGMAQKRIGQGLRNRNDLHARGVDAHCRLAVAAPEMA